MIFSILLKLSFSGKKYRFLENDNSFLKTTFFCKMEKIIVFGKTRTFFLKTTLFSKMEKLSFFGKRELFFGGDNAFRSTILIYPTFFRADTISCHPVCLFVPYSNCSLSNFGPAFARVGVTLSCRGPSSLSQLLNTLKDYRFRLKFRQFPAPA